MQVYRHSTVYLKLFCMSFRKIGQALPKLPKNCFRIVKFSLSCFRNSVKFVQIEKFRLPGKVQLKQGSAQVFIGTGGLELTMLGYWLALVGLTQLQNMFITLRRRPPEGKLVIITFSVCL